MKVDILNVKEGIWLEKDVVNKLKGYLAEKIFELIHTEMEFQVYRSGQETLYPFLFHVANTRKKLLHKVAKEQDLEELKERYENIPIIKDIVKPSPQLVGKERFEKSAIGKKIARSPDFTIITHAGEILQFEVKFRNNGILSEKDKQKYLKLRPSPYIFLVMGVEPYIRILEPDFDFNGDIPHEQLFLKLDLDKVKAIVDDEDRREYIDEELERFTEEYVIKNGGKRDYREISQGCMLGGNFVSEMVFYTPKLLEKYRKIVKETFMFQDHNR